MRDPIDPPLNTVDATCRCRGGAYVGGSTHREFEVSMSVDTAKGTGDLTPELLESTVLVRLR